MMQRKRWDELSSEQQTKIIVGSIIEVVLTTAALVDLARRPADLVRGPKWAWAAGAFVQPVGPVAYFAFGRRKRVEALNP
jgi:Phospholipase_D-nuclease N-terminal